jgi:hypothetical protein
VEAAKLEPVGQDCQENFKGHYELCFAGDTWGRDADGRGSRELRKVPRPKDLIRTGMKVVVFDDDK